jgi:predicted dehydrogenase
MAMTRRARIGVIGTGWWATYAHLPTMQADPRAEVVAIADSSPERLAQAAEHFGISGQFADYRQLLDSVELDGVIVATPHNTHFDIARDVLERGIPLLLEKPMVLRARDARDLQRLAEKRNVPLIVGYPYHFIEQHTQLRSRIREGALGQLQLVHTLFASMVLEYFRANPQAYAEAFAWQVTGPQANTYSDPRIAGGGQGHLQLTHNAALLLWLTGLQAVEVAAFMEGFGLPVDVCDAVTVRFESGTIGTLASTGAIPTPQQSHSQLELRVYGSEGYAWLDAMAGTCSIFYNDGRIERLDNVPADGRYPMASTSRHLVELILDPETPNQSPAEVGVRTVELLEAAYRAAAEGRVVRVDEL